MTTEGRSRIGDEIADIKDRRNGYSVDLSRKTLARQLSGNRTNRKTVVGHPSKTSELP